MSVIWTDIAIFRCPACGEKARVDGPQPFHKRLRKPEPFACPRCDATVAWARTPIRIFQVGEWLLPLSFVPIFIDGFAFWSVPILGLAGLVLCVGMLAQRLECYAPPPGEAG